MQTVSEFIDELGGTVAVADALELSPTTVSSWKSSNSIPRWRAKELRLVAAEKGVEYPSEFAPPPPAPPASAEAA
jgi:hypothetical protein